MVRGRKNRTPDPAEADEADFDLDGGADENTYYVYRRTTFQRVILVVGTIICVACFASVAALAYGGYAVSQIKQEDVALAAASDDEPQNWLIVGSDSREAIAKNDPTAAVFTGGGEGTGGQRSDTIMVLRIDPKGSHLDVLSLQRDLWLPIARTGGDERINSAYSWPD